jgi:parallel beta-helix repeat protein
MHVPHVAARGFADDGVSRRASVGSSRRAAVAGKRERCHFQPVMRCLPGARLADAGRLAIAAALGAALAGCFDAGDGCTVTVARGAADTELQSALIDARPGSTICLEEGTYVIHTELSLAVDRVTVRGAGRDRTVLDHSAQDLGAGGLIISSDGVTIEALTVLDTPGDGIRASFVKDIAFIDVAVRWSKAASVDNGAYGLYPVGSDGVRVERCTVVGARDAGIYVGQSQRILVADSEAHGNVAGIEIENSTDAEVRGNLAHDNTAGILVFNLPDLPVQDGKRAKVHHNRVVQNNLPSFAEKGTIVASVPHGSGLIVLASDANELHDNVVEDNDSVGLLLLSWIEALFGPNEDPRYDAFPQRNFIHANAFARNGGKPADVVAAVAPTPVPDVLWDGCYDPAVGATADLNCLRGNGAATYANVNFCQQMPLAGPDLASLDCSYPSLPGQDP